MKWVLFILGTFGLYILLNHWTSMHGTVVFTALGMNFTLFGILFVVGAVLIARATVLGGKH